MEQKNYNLPKGAILSQATLKQFIEEKDLVFYLIDSEISYEELLKNDQIDETSISLHIGELRRHSKDLFILDLNGKYDDSQHYEYVIPDEYGCILIEPKEFLLGKTLEKITTPNSLIGIIEERRTAAGNLGLTIKGFVPPGLEAEQVRITITNNGRLPVKIYIGKIPPMKALFQTLSSSEKYRKDRETRVKKGQGYSSGAGNKVVQLGAILASLSFKNTIKIKQQLNVKFRLENASSFDIHLVKISPLLNINAFDIASCSSQWELNEEVVTSHRYSWFSKRHQKSVKSIKYEKPIQKNEIINGTLGLIFFEAMDTEQFKFEIECYTKDNIKVAVREPTEYHSLTIKSRFPILSSKITERLLDSLVTTAIIAFIYTLFTYQPIREFFINLWNNFIDRIS